jgi:hypothetical protein
MSLSARQSSYVPEGPLGFYLAPVAALIYPATLWSFHLSVNAFETGERVLASVTAASVSLALRSRLWRGRTPSLPGIASLSPVSSMAQKLVEVQADRGLPDKSSS